MPAHTATAVCRDSRKMDFSFKSRWLLVAPAPAVIARGMRWTQVGQAGPATVTPRADVLDREHAADPLARRWRRDVLGADDADDRLTM